MVSIDYGTKMEKTQKIAEEAIEKYFSKTDGWVTEKREAKPKMKEGFCGNYTPEVTYTISNEGDTVLEVKYGGRREPFTLGISWKDPWYGDAFDEEFKEYVSSSFKNKTCRNCGMGCEHGPC